MKGNNNPSKDSRQNLYSQSFSPNPDVSTLGFFVFSGIYIKNIVFMRKKNLISEISRMRSLFNYKTGDILLEDLTPNQQKALSMGFGPVTAQYAEQLASQGKLNSQPFYQQYNPSFSTQFLVNCSNVPGVSLPATAEMQKSFAASSGLNPNTPENKIFFCDTASMNRKLSEIRSKTQQNVGAAAPSAPAKPKPLQFVAEKFPLKYMMQGENVKKLQQALGVVDSKGQANISGKFYNATQKALDLKAKELGLNYNRNVGLDETSFNEIIQAAQPKRQLEKPVPLPTTTKSVADLKVDVKVPANISAQPTQIQAAPVQLTLDQQFQMAKANLDVAKGELDAAQKTGDRAAIGAARGKQQAARKEVQRLRAELAAQNQPQQ